MTVPNWTWIVAIEGVTLGNSTRPTGFSLIADPGDGLRREGAVLGTYVPLLVPGSLRLGSQEINVLAGDPPAQSFSVSLLLTPELYDVLFEQPDPIGVLAGPLTADDTSFSVAVHEIAGAQSLSRKAVMRGTGIDSVVLEDLFSSYNTTVDSTLINQATTGLDAIATQVAYTDSSPTAAELQYKNIEVASTSATASITWLNIDAADINPFFHKDAVELLPGRYSLPDGAGVDILRGSTDQGFEVVMGKKFDNSTFTTLYTLDILFGVVMTNPEFCGVLLFDQVP
jgi:hypothetical protein